MKPFGRVATSCARAGTGKTSSRAAWLSARWWSICLVLLIAAGALLMFHAGTARAQGSITVSNPKVESKFADHITYSITAKSDSDITAATLFVRYLTAANATTTRGKGEFTPGKNVTATYTRTLTRGDLVPGTDIEYYWQIDNSAGQTLKTDTYKYSYPDDRFAFKSMSAPVGKGE